MNRTKQQARRREFKKTVDADDMRRRRSNNAALLRKSKREESLMKRRNAALSGRALGGLAPTQITVPTQSDLAQLTSAASLERIGAQLRSNEPSEALIATTDIRRMLSVERDPPIDTVLSIGALEPLIQFLQHHEQHGQLALEAAWAITNIASGTSAHTRAVVQAGGIPVFIELLANGNELVRDQCVWALGNIAGDGSQLRDMCLKNDVMTALLYQYETEPAEGLLRNTTWAVSNLCRGKPAPEFSQVSACLDVLPALLQQGDKDTKVDACWAISYLTDGDDEKIQAVVDSGVCPELVRMMADEDKQVQTPALRAVGNIVTGSSEQTQAIVDLKPFDALKNLMRSTKRTLVKEACWTISNITAGEANQIGAVIDSGIMDMIGDILASSSPQDIKKEACWALSNATTGGSTAQTREMIQDKHLMGLTNMLKAKDPRTISVALEALQNILAAGETSDSKFSENPFADSLEEVGGLDVLDDMQNHQNEDIYNMVVDLLEKYFSDDQDVCDENIAPNSTSADKSGAKTFAFGLQTNSQPGAFAF